MLNEKKGNFIRGQFWGGKALTMLATATEEKHSSWNNSEIYPHSNLLEII